VRAKTIDSATVLTIKYGPEVARIIHEIHTGQLSPETLELIAQVQPLVDEILDAIAEEFNSLSVEEQAELIGRITAATTDPLSFRCSRERTFACWSNNHRS